jgi:hypothetical protein
MQRSLRLQQLEWENLSMKRANWIMKRQRLKGAANVEDFSNVFSVDTIVVKKK